MSTRLAFDTDILLKNPTSEKVPTEVEMKREKNN